MTFSFHNHCPRRLLKNIELLKNNVFWYIIVAKTVNENKKYLGYYVFSCVLSQRYIEVLTPHTLEIELPWKHG